MAGFVDRPHRRYVAKFIICSLWGGGCSTIGGKGVLAARLLCPQQATE
jgi:hypothetical protein